MGEANETSREQCARRHDGYQMIKTLSNSIISRHNLTSEKGNDCKYKQRGGAEGEGSAKILLLIKNRLRK